MVKWPAFIKHADDVELTYINDQQMWESDRELHEVVYDETDFLVDSDGVVYCLTSKINDTVLPELKGEVLTLREILGLIKAHAANTDACCVAKLYAPSITEAFKILESLGDN